MAATSRNFETRNWRFSTRTLLVAIFVLCVLMAVVPRRAANQRRAAQLVVALGGTIAYAHAQIDGNYAISDKIAPPGPAWLRRLVGDDYFVELSFADFSRIPLNEEEFDRLIDHLSRVPTLHHLLVNCSELPAASLARFGELMHLKCLVLCGLDCSADDLRLLGQLTYLEELTLWGPRVDGDLAPLLRRMRHVTKLELTGPWCTNATLEVLPEMRALSTLSVHSPAVTSSGLQPLAALPHLWELDLSIESWDDNALSTIGRLKKLEQLRLSVASGDNLPNNMISDVGFSHLRDLQELVSLELWKFAVGGPRMKELGALPHLESLRIVESELLTADEVAALKQFPRLEFLAATMDDAHERELQAAKPDLCIFNE